MTTNSIFGFMALIVYVMTLIPSNLAKVFPYTKQWTINRYLLKQRRFLGLTAFALSAGHVIISFAQYQINLLFVETYITYYTGISIFIIFTILAFTSNNWSIRQLKQHKWRLLHQLTYVAMTLLLWHIWTVMKSSWTVLTPIGLYLISFAFFMYITRLLIVGIRNLLKNTRSPQELPKLLPAKLNSTEKTNQKIEIL